jgi:hypothetical protein
MKAPSNPMIEELLSDPEARQEFGRQLRSGVPVSRDGTRVIQLFDRNRNKFVRLILSPARYPFQI